MNRRIAILGCGWLGLPLAESFVQKNYPVSGSTTSESKLGTLKSKGIKPFLISITEDGVLGDITTFFDDVATLIVNIPPKLRGPSKENYVQKMHLLLEEVKRSNIKRVIFISSTSVYGNKLGRVTEDTVPEPSTESGLQLLEAENIFKHSKALQTTIIRFGGLIGDDRHPIKMLSGRKELTNGNINLIHLKDCIHIITYILTKNWWPKIVNGVYPYHPKKEKYYTSEAKKRKVQLPHYKQNNLDNDKRIVPFALLSVKEFSFNTSIIS